MKLYNMEYCPYCVMVREKLDSLGLTYDKIEVPPMQHMRQEVFEVSGQYTVPVLVDEDQVFDDENKIISYLDDKYGK